MSYLQWGTLFKTGPLYLVASESGLEGVFWEKQSVPEVKSLRGRQPGICHLAEAARQLDEYLDGQRREFDLQLNIVGTDFQKKVWSQLQSIPYGQTVSYRDIARRIKNEKAVRAVGSANGKNRFPILIPCHRVVAADGTLGGFTGGLDKKIKLLELEKSFLSSLVRTNVTADQPPQLI